jgi:ribonuclease HI
MRIYCDSSTREDCYVITGQEPVVCPYNKVVTNNEGEYRAALKAIYVGLAQKFNPIWIMTDSKLVVEQFLGNYNCHNDNLKLYLRELDELAKYHWFANTIDISLHWIPREENLAGIELEKIAKRRRK